MVHWLTVADPESLAWDLLDEEFRKKLDVKTYVSLSQDSTFATGAIADGSIQTSEDEHNLHIQSTKRARSSTRSGNAVGKGKAVRHTDLELDPKESDDDGEDLEDSLFHYKMPGVLSKKEVERLDLDHWKIVVRKRLMDMKVCPYH